MLIFYFLQGHSYEKAALDKWFAGHNTSPLTNRELKDKKYVINYNLKSAIEEFRLQQRETRLKMDFRSFRICRGRSKEFAWGTKPKMKIVISLLGPTNVGKSSLVDNIEYAQPQEIRARKITVATDISFFYLDRLFEDKYVVVIQVNDCPGNDRFEAVSDRHFRNCHGAVLMSDTTNIDSFERLEKYWYKQLRDKSSFDSVEAVLACNKIDLLEENYDACYRETFFREADSFASRHQIPIFNISAVRGDNIQSMFHHLIWSILQNPSLVTYLKENPMEATSKTSADISTVKISISSAARKTKRKKSSCC